MKANEHTHFKNLIELNKSIEPIELIELIELIEMLELNRIFRNKNYQFFFFCFLKTALHLLLYTV